MDIKVKDIAPANQTTPVKAQEKSDDSFKFTLFRQFCQIGIYSLFSQFIIVTAKEKSLPTAARKDFLILSILFCC